MLTIGETIRDYKILSKIGEGGMGAVYLAEDTSLDKKVAIKVLSPSLLSDEQFVERFKNEAKIQAMLSHPNIVTLHSLIMEDSKYLMVMEYVNGKTLKHIISEQGPFSEQKAKKYFLQILDAIGFAHSMGIVHRDLKPSNILIDVNDNVKILDFGIAKVLGDRSLTKTGSKMGTIFYMSPEQIRAEKNINQRTDIYSLGIVFYEMLTGTLPFNTQTESDFEIMKQIVEGRGIDETFLEGRVSDVMIKVLKKMTEKKSEHRFATCYQISEALISNNVPEDILNIGINDKNTETADNNVEFEEETIEINNKFFPKADFGKRISAFIIDGIVFAFLLGIMIDQLVKSANQQENYAVYVIIFLFILILSLIRDGLNKGKGVGKNIIGLRMIDLENGKVISKGKALKRRILELVFYGVSSAISAGVGGFILIVIEIILSNTGNGQRLVDKILSVQVVNESDIIVDSVTLEVKPSELALYKLSPGKRVIFK